MMCFSEYLENQNYKQMYLYEEEMSNYTSSFFLCILNAQF